MFLDYPNLIYFFKIIGGLMTKHYSHKKIYMTYDHVGPVASYFLIVVNTVYSLSITHVFSFIIMVLFSNMYIGSLDVPFCMCTFDFVNNII